MRIGFLSAHNPHDPTAFSGTTRHSYLALTRLPGAEVRIIGAHPAFALRLRHKIGLPVKHGGALTASMFDGLDVVVSLVSTPMVIEAARLTDLPILHITDATPLFLREFYGFDVPDSAIAAERAAIDAAALTVYSSDFMRQRALAEFGEDIAKGLATVPFGTNLDDLPTTPMAKPAMPPVSLLHVTTDWERKGGPVAVETLKALRARGIDARLTIIGRAPEGIDATEGVDALGFLAKGVGGDLARIRAAFRAAHFLLLPTRADCTPMVIAEASSHAAPSLASDVGGMATLVAEGSNGFLMPLTADGEAYAGRIAAVLAEDGAYETLSRSSFEVYASRLNWDAWARAIAGMLEGLTARR